MTRPMPQAMAIAPSATSPAETIESVLIQGDLSQLSPEQKLSYYLKVCESLGLNPYTKPFDYLKLQGKEILYARKDATDQLRKINGVSVTKIDHEQLGDLYIVTVYAKDKTGRTDSDIGAVNIKGLTGENLANAMLKAMTKAKRRVTLSICGLGMTDDSEVESIPGAQRADFELPANLEVDLETGEVGEPMTERDKAIEAWVAASDEATRLKIVHKQLPDNADLALITRWTEALTGKIYEATQTAPAF